MLSRKNVAAAIGETLAAFVSVHGATDFKIFKQLHKPDEWFTYHLKAIGNRIWVTVNGDLLYEYDDHANTYKTGHFAFQQHNLGSVVKIRKFEVKELASKTKK